MILLGLWVGCAPIVPSPEASKQPSEVPVHRSTEDDTVLFHIPFGMDMDDDLLTNALTEAAKGVDYSRFIIEIKYDSAMDQIGSHFSEEENLPYRPLLLTSDESAINLTFVLDRDRIASYVTSLATNADIVSFTPVGTVNPEMRTEDSFDYLPDNMLLMPCPGIVTPKWSNLLPNAPRAYRSGTHRGIDFPSPYGSEIQSVASGVVIRADRNYTEVTNRFRESLLEKAATIGRTPSDVFEHILFGRAVFIDHGLDLVEGKRLVSIYAHLSEIADGIVVGAKVARGETLGKVGNSGTSDGAKGNRESAHLHFELIIQDKTGERYMGQGLPDRELKKLLNRLFVSE